MDRPDPSELQKVVDFAAREAGEYLNTLADRPVRSPRADEVAASFGGPLRDEGIGAVQALEELVAGFDAAVHSAGPKFFHFVDGGVTPAALGADWLASTTDQNPGAWVSTPLAARLEQVSIEWLKDLFGLPASMGGVLTTGATMANFVALACARRWCAERAGIDVDEVGLAGAPPITVLGGGYTHPSDIKALGMLGLGRARVRKIARDIVGRVDLEAMEAALRDLDGAPAIVIGSAGEVNAGDFDPLNNMADLAERYGAWFHVDGAFGLFAALSPRTQHLVAGVDRADSVIADGHKWLNVPYENGFAFVRDQALLPAVFGGAGAAYLPDVDEPQPNWGYRGPEMSRRARSFPVWATLRAYGRDGHRAIVEHDLDLAQRLAGTVDAAPDLERLADVPLNVVCFRYRPAGSDDGPELDDLNRRIGEAAIVDGRVFFGSTVYGGRVAFRPAIVNWRSREQDVDLVAQVVRELGARFSTES
ncbi:MAG TPA: pyridoxal-dependent decarboxylase [Actinomycetota bacterium]|nr:pyridoxal-dependent decarboxylase [Actinomycetota bacterium]